MIFKVPNVADYEDLLNLFAQTTMQISVVNVTLLTISGTNQCSIQYKERGNAQIKKE